jgi:hypothetical protein
MFERVDRRERIRNYSRMNRFERPTLRQSRSKGEGFQQRRQSYGLNR